MKICVTAKGNDLSSETDPRFGRCGFFVFYDTETEKYEFCKNEYAADSGGAGTKSGSFVAEKGARLVITGRVGPNAERVLSAAGITVIPDVKGSVEEAVKNSGYKKN